MVFEDAEVRYAFKTTEEAEYVTMADVLKEVLFYDKANLAFYVAGSRYAMYSSIRG